MAEEIDFYSRANGALGKKQDWYTLVIPDDGIPAFVKHAWRYRDTNGEIELSSGELDVPIPDFLSKEYPDDAKERLRSLLAAKSLGLSHA